MANSSETSGTAWERTSQKTMPRGVVTTSTLTAERAGGTAICFCMSASIGFVFLAPPGADPPLPPGKGLGGGLSRRLERREMPGHRGLANEPPARGLSHRFRAHRLDPRRPFLDVAQALADRQGRTVPAREI